MIEVKNIDFLYPSVFTNLRATSEFFYNLQNYQAIRHLVEAKQFADRHPVISTFLVILFILGFFPVFLFLAFAVASAVLVFFSAAVFLSGILLVGVVPFLTVFIPVLMFGGAFSVQLYCMYRLLVVTRRCVQQLKNVIISGPSTRVSQAIKRNFNETPVLTADAQQDEVRINTEQINEKSSELRNQMLHTGHEHIDALSSYDFVTSRAF